MDVIEFAVDVIEFAVKFDSCFAMVIIQIFAIDFVAYFNAQFTVFLVIRTGECLFRILN